MEQKLYAVIGVALLSVLAFGLLATYAVPTAIANAICQRGDGHAWWTEGLTEQQVNEIRSKIWDIRERASAQGWTEEQTRTAIHELLTQYGINPQGLGFLDADGDGICDHLGMNRGQGHGYRQWQCWNQTTSLQT